MRLRLLNNLELHQQQHQKTKIPTFLPHQTHPAHLRGDDLFLMILARAGAASGTLGGGVVGALSW
jgi:hypothetical protein